MKIISYRLAMTKSCIWKALSLAKCPETTSKNLQTYERCLPWCLRILAKNFSLWEQNLHNLPSGHLIEALIGICFTTANIKGYNTASKRLTISTRRRAHFTKMMSKREGLSGSMKTITVRMSSLLCARADAVTHRWSLSAILPIKSISDIR